MKYKLINENQNINNPIITILNNRGINDIDTYLNLNDSCLCDYWNLDNIQEGIDCLNKHIENDSKIGIIVDSDADGYCSATIMYKYLMDTNPLLNVEYYIHAGKEHGISKDINISEDINLLIVPDGGTNDRNACEKLKEKNIDVLILDHHEKEIDNPYAIIINNQISEKYTNKQLCGAGIVYKFLQAFDDVNWTNYAEKYIDLVAIGNISDLMDIKSYETRYLIKLGLNNISNKLINGFIKKQSYSIGDKINMCSISYYITPLINAMCRLGSQQEKELMFRGFIETDEFFDYKKRGSDTIEQESIYDKVPRICVNIKNRQSKIIDSFLPSIKQNIEDKLIINNKIMFVKIPTNIDIDNTFTGLVAMKLAELYKRPCILLRKNSKGLYVGSARNFSECSLIELKDFLNNTKKFEYLLGHQGAFGVGIKNNNIVDVINYCNTVLNDIDLEQITVDFILDCDEFSIDFIKQIDSLQDYYGTGIKEPKIVVENIKINKNMCSVMGKENNSWKIILDNNISLVKFKVDENDIILNWINDDSNNNSITINVIGKVGFNTYNGIINPQMIIEEYEEVI